MVKYNYNPNDTVCITSKRNPKYKSTCSYADILQQNEAGGAFLVKHLEAMLADVNKAYSMIQDTLNVNKHPTAVTLNYVMHFMLALMYTEREDEVAISALLSEMINSCTVKVNDKEVDTKTFFKNLTNDMLNIFEADYELVWPGA